MTRLSLEEEYARLHPVYVAVSKAFAANPPDHKSIPLPQLRDIVDGYTLQMRGKFPDVLVEDKMIPMKEGVDEMDEGQVEIRMVRPPGTENVTLPGVVFLHGGGWVFGNKETYLKTLADFAVRAHVAIIYVEYSKSPEVKYPTALHQSYAVTQWLHNHGNSIHVNPDQLATCGDSAGGNMASAICLLAKERGFPNLIKTQILLYPTISGSHEERLGLTSIQRFGSTADFGLSLEQIDTALYSYSGSLENKTDPLIAPLNATTTTLEGLPPCLLIMADSDALRSENELFATKLMQADVETIAIRMYGTTHGFMQMTVPFDTPQYMKTLSLMAAHLNDTFS